MRRRKVLAKSVRSVIEALESRTLLSGSLLTVGTGTASITGTVYNDANANGALNNGETGIPAAVVFLDTNANGIQDSNEPGLTTDSNGGFTFSSLAAGQYNVVVVPQAGLVQAPTPYSVSLHDGASATVQIGEVLAGSAGNIGIGEVNGVVFNDPNQDGIFDPLTEDFLAGDTVYLDTNGNGVLDPGEPSTITNNVGFYSFDEAPGSYEVVILPRSGFHQDPPGYAQVQITSNTQTQVNIGENNLTTISGAVFEDLNGNGLQEAGEPSVSGETVFIDQNFDGAFEAGEPSGVTDATGHYVITNIGASGYRLGIASAQGMVQDNPGFVNVVVNQGQNLIQNLGEGLPSTISGTVFDDKNANGVQDPGELGLINQAVFADVNANGVLDANGSVDVNGNPTPADPSATTAADGSYLLSNLGPGTYTIRVVDPAGAVTTAPLNATHSYSVTVGSGQSVANENFGFQTADLTIALLKYPTAPSLTNVTKHAIVRITNVGSLPANGLVGFTLYASTTTPLNTGASTIIFNLNGRKTHLLPGQSKTIAVSFKYPTQLPLNSYYITAQVNSAVDDNNAGNDLSTTIGPIQIGPPYIDLGVTYAAQPPLFVMPTESSVLSLIVTNTGNVTSTGGMTFRIYAAPNDQLEPDDVIAARVPVGGRIKPGHSKTFNLTLPYPGLMLGARFIIVAVDSGDKLGELNQGNNVALPIQSTFFQ